MAGQAFLQDLAHEFAGIVLHALGAGKKGGARRLGRGRRSGVAISRRALEGGDDEDEFGVEGVGQVGGGVDVRGMRTPGR